MAPDESRATKTDTSFEAVRKRLGTESGTLAEFEVEYGPITPRTKIKVYAVAIPPR
jgi:hypothetical protein